MSGRHRRADPTEVPPTTAVPDGAATGAANGAVGDGSGAVATGAGGHRRHPVVVPLVAPEPVAPATASAAPPVPTATSAASATAATTNGTPTVAHEAGGSGRRRRGGVVADEPAPALSPPAPRPEDDRPTYLRGRTAPAAVPPPVAPVTPATAEGVRARLRGLRARPRLLAALAAGLVLAVLATVLVVRATTGGGGGGGSAATTTATLLVQVTSADGTAPVSAVAAVSSSARSRAASAAVLLLPSRLIVDVPGAGQLPFGEVRALEGERRSADALADLLSLRVDASWVLTEAGLRSLVDALGGIEVTVDTQVARKEANGAVTVLVPAGPQRMSGALAATYVTYLGAEEAEQLRLSRWNDVLTALVEALPSDADTAAQRITALGRASTSSWPVPTLVTHLLRLRSAAAAGPLTADVLPVRDIDTGLGPVSYGVDANAADALLRRSFAGAISQNAGATRVLVQNGVGVPGLNEKAREKLVGAGLRYVDGGNAPTFDYKTTAVVIPDAGDESRRRGEEVAAALGVPATALQLSSSGQTVADVIVVLGRDFRP